MCVCVYVRERERERERGSHHKGVSCLNRGLCTANIYEFHHCVCHLCSPFGFELMVKLTTLLTVFIFTLKAEAHVMVRSVAALVVFGQSQCTRSIGQSEQTVLVGRRGFVENLPFERGGAYNTIMFSI